MPSESTEFGIIVNTICIHSTWKCLPETSKELAPSRTSERWCFKPVWPQRGWKKKTVQKRQRKRRFVCNTRLQAELSWSVSSLVRQAVQWLSASTVFRSVVKGQRFVYSGHVLLSQHVASESLSTALIYTVQYRGLFIDTSVIDGRYSAQTNVSHGFLKGWTLNLFCYCFFYIHHSQIYSSCLWDSCLCCLSCLCVAIATHIIRRCCFGI